ncbi:adhesion G-protein coupled receptor G2-like [Parambassis ranga]|uniref:Adhesion G-protein coupled receptor G2-like n=1 Tax=Parambassis ranga TaxID=210632 RepID=A0A6P7HZI4_9TELE|nr:adhesion G-protein coupled receptor G2-like [Parambassis ranga]
MKPHIWMIWILLVGSLWFVSLSSSPSPVKTPDNFENCFKKTETTIVVVDNFYGCITASKWNYNGDSCIIFVKRNITKSMLKLETWPQIEKDKDDFRVYLSKWHTNRDINMYILNGKNCSAYQSVDRDTKCRNFTNDPCEIRCVPLNSVCSKSTYDAASCGNKNNIMDRYLINITTPTIQCINCDNPVKKPDGEMVLNITIKTDNGGSVDASQAAELVRDMSNLVKNMNGSSAELKVGAGITGVLVKQREPEDVSEVSFAYTKPNQSINIIEDRNSLDGFSRSVTVSKEAFKKSQATNTTQPFAAVFRFTNLAKDENNSTVLGNEVLAVEMGTTIANLTDKININFKKIKFKGIPSCHSWNGNGSKPNWTDDGCTTIEEGENITCRCSHLTFFAILLTPLNETIPSSDLHNLTIITQVGCGVSMFFLSITLFMHFLLRRKKASRATQILIHLVMAMFLLDFTFLINTYVANVNSDVACKIMAALMHYFMLATFTWFAVHAFHLCLQLYMRGKIVIHHYMLKVSVTSWVLPSVVGIVLLSVGKYGQQTIYADKPENNVAMCWITDNNTHYLVNIGYYVLVFLFTFTTFIVILSWLFCLKRSKATNLQMSHNGKNIMTIMGLCCMLGITWGFAFFAYGVLQIPAYYIFTILNSFQGLFLFIYYYNNSHSAEPTSQSGPGNLSSTSSTGTLKTALDTCENPYVN